MKFLIITRKQTMPIPREMGISLYQAATAWVNAGLADGTIDCHYVFAETGGFAITNAPSHEAVFDGLLSYPLFPFFEWEIKALCDWGHTYESIIQYFENLPG